MFQVFSEIEPLRKVLLHRPGREIENVTPDEMSQLLFDDIPYLPAMQKEHDVFADTLRSQGVEVVYLHDWMTTCLQDDEPRIRFLERMAEASMMAQGRSASALKEYLLDLDAGAFVEKMMSGVRKEELPEQRRQHLYELMTKHYPFYLAPMPNLYFTRDPAAVIGHGISLNPMSQEARKRESMFMECILEEDAGLQHVPRWMTRDHPFPVEGGDQLVLDRWTVAIGVSERTSARAVEDLAASLFASSDFQRVVVVEIPKKRASMHLDTVFTMVDTDQFTTHAEVIDKDGQMNIFLLERGDPLTITRWSSLSAALKEVLGLSEINMIPCGGGDKIASAREQWNDGSNTLAVAPGVVVTYERNYVSNELMRRNGLQVLEVPSSELVRGRGGPRCMSMPLVRGDSRA